MKIQLEKKYLNLPVKNDADKRRMRLVLDGETTREFAPTAGLQLICPRVAKFCVMRSVLAPDRAAARDASVPAWPPPITMTSKLLFMALVNICAIRGRPF